ncbi:hypothetical protein AvCA_41910 [Azotobacter vinelandii CA]|uniref:Uncharacterized protein n=2 Tax=Azotobacter vinelandii TaxID=354 RepID=C1DEZ0_AZOVD|nr:hypothetical protein Avin_41910 [Azotobacter vinelandii DJ]AGK16033.1 hypothetical protein AvCA_41910 [Azotobacter vinelandii CA]AGK21845.1 hypothetical protein AvCA6_41910 [Azotobacter vinelandii CA6]
MGLFDRVDLVVIFLDPRFFRQPFHKARRREAE